MGCDAVVEFEEAGSGQWLRALGSADCACCCGACNVPLGDSSCLLRPPPGGLSCRQLKYETGDHVGMYARNSDVVVAEVANLLGLPLDTTFKLHVDGPGAR